MNKFGHIVMLVVNNLRAIEVQEVTLDEGGQFVRLTGNNGTGKSTFLEAIEVLFNGGKLPNGVIRNGQKEALIEGKFSGGYTARRRIRKNKNKKQVAELVVTGPDGQPVPAAGSVLKDLFSGFITPAKMASASGADLYKKVVSFLGVDIDVIEADIFDKKVVASEKRGALNSLGEISPPESPRPEQAAFDSDRYMALFTIQKDGEAATNRRNVLVGEHDDIQRQIDNLNHRLEMIDIQIKECHNASTAAAETRPEYAALCQAKEIADNSGGLIKAWDEYDRWSQASGEASKAYDEAVEMQKAAEAGLRTTLASAVGPGGVRVTEDRKVVIGETAWELAAFSERMLAATMMQVEGSDPARLPLVFIEHGESLNTEKQREIAKAAIEKGATVFIEVMDEDVNELVISTEAAVGVEWADGVTHITPDDSQDPGPIPMKTEVVPELVLTQEQAGRISPPGPPPTTPVPGPPPSAVDDFDIF